MPSFSPGSRSAVFSDTSSRLIEALPSSWKVSRSSFMCTERTASTLAALRSNSAFSCSMRRRIWRITCWFLPRRP